MNFAVMWLFAKFSLQNLEGWHTFARQKGTICESFLHAQNRIFHQFSKVFSLEGFPLYGSSRPLVCY